MCEPTTLMIASLAISAATTVASTIGAQQQASAQASYQEQAGRAAVTNANNQYAMNNRRISEEQAAAGAAIEQNSIEAAQARSRARVAASAAGVSGLSVDSLLMDVYNQEGRRNNAVRTNLGYTVAALSDEATGIHAGTQSAVNQSRKAVASPGWGSAALQIGASALNSYNTYFPDGGNPFGGGTP